MQSASTYRNSLGLLRLLVIPDVTYCQRDQNIHPLRHIDVMFIKEMLATLWSVNRRDRLPIQQYTLCLREHFILDLNDWGIRMLFRRNEFDS